MVYTVASSGNFVRTKRTSTQVAFLSDLLTPWRHLQYPPSLYPSAYVSDHSRLSRSANLVPAKNAVDLCGSRTCAPRQNRFASNRTLRETAFQSHRFRQYDAYTAEKLEFGSGAVYRGESIKFLDFDKNRHSNAYSTHINGVNSSNSLQYHDGSSEDKQPSLQNQKRPFSIVEHVAETHTIKSAAVSGNIYNVWLQFYVICVL